MPYPIEVRQRVQQLCKNAIAADAANGERLKGILSAER